MDFTQINFLLDKVCEFVTTSGQKHQDYETQLAAKDAQIVDLQAQLKTLTSTVSADDAEIKLLMDKLSQLSSFVAPTPNS